jgi:hypothetical protein
MIKRFTNFSIEIDNNHFCKPNIKSFDNDSVLADIDVNVTGSILDAIEIDDDVFCINDGGFSSHKDKKQPFIFNDYFELVKLSSDFSSFKKISRHYENLYKILGIFSDGRQIFIPIIFCNEGFVTIEVHQFSSDLIFIKRNFCLMLEKGRKHFIPNIHFIRRKRCLFVINFADIAIINNVSQTEIEVEL